MTPKQADKLIRTGEMVTLKSARFIQEPLIVGKVIDRDRWTLTIQLIGGAIGKFERSDLVQVQM